MSTPAPTQPQLPRTRNLKSMNTNSLISQVNAITSVTIDSSDNYKRFLKYCKILDTFNQSIKGKLENINISYNTKNQSNKDKLTENIKTIIQLNSNINLLNNKKKLINPNITKNNINTEINKFSNLNSNNKLALKAQSGRYNSLLTNIANTITSLNEKKKK